MKNIWSLDIAPDIIDENGFYFRAEKNCNQLITVSYKDGNICASLYYDGRPGIPIGLRAKAEAPIRIRLVNDKASISLITDGFTADKDWPLGYIDLDGASLTGTYMISDDISLPEKAKSAFNGIHGWQPSENIRVGDCMPFSHNGIFRLYYLADRHGHKSKYGLGAHRWAQVFSRDLKQWNPCDIALDIDEQFEGSICTGSVCFFNDRYYAFYAVRMSDGSPAKLSYAISSDGEHYVKSGQYFTLSSRYHSPSARDPRVFAGIDGKYHMLVTTSLMNGSSPGSGCLAHLTGDTPESFSEAGEFITLDIKDQPECSDYFYYGGRYYLVYSNFGVAHYFISDGPSGPWRKPDNNVVVSEQLRVPKFAVWNGRLFAVGFVSADGSYAGKAGFYEASVLPDGSFTFSVPDEVIAL